ncbi:DUF6223 family protein [Streptosporangium sandarakinum]|uniref:DUF6223 family protein n=1 Tax=Streptosporangium sandarakinum TaxID=1260955 RepID=UPI00344394A9
MSSVRHLLATAGAALSGGPGSAAPVSAHVLAEPVGVGYFTTGRIWAMVGIALVLAGVVAGRLALRAAGRTGRQRAVTAMASGLAGTVVGGLVVVNSEGGPGTGGGIVGGYLALALGVAAMILGWRALARSRRTA